HARHHDRDGHARAGRRGLRQPRGRVQRRPHRRRLAPRASALMFLQTVLMALREIRRNTLRSVLTMLGVVIGVGAVIALVSVGRGATAKVTEDIGKLGKNLLTVSAGTFSRGGGGMGVSAPPLRIDDANAIRRE